MSTNKHKKNPAGVTLIELTIAISIFSVVIIIALETFLNVLKFGREAVQKQSIQDHSEFLFGLMSKEIRTAKINYNGDCDEYFHGLGATSEAVPLNSTYLAVKTGKDDATGNDKYEELRFQNYEGWCVRYFIKLDTTLNTNLLMVERHDPSTNITKTAAQVLPSNIEVTNLYFTAQNMFDNHSEDGSGLTQPPAVKYSIKLRSTIWDPSDITLFNLIVGRNMEQF